MSDVLERFKHHQDEVWEKLSEELGGEFIDKEGWRNDKIRVRHGDWTVTLDLYAHRGARLNALYTRFRAPYVNEEKLRIRIFRQELVHGLARLVGMQDIRVGDDVLDRMFVIQCTDAARMKELMADEELRALLRQEPEMELAVREADKWFGEEFPDGVDELVLAVPGEVKDPARIKRLYDTFARALQGLCRLSPAYRRDTMLDPK